MKKINVGVVFRGSDTAKVLIELTPDVAKKIVNGHKNLNEDLCDQIKRATDWIDAQLS